MVSGKALLAYATVSLFWGSTYLAIRIGVRDMPPLLLGATRFLGAGLILLLVGLLTGRRLPRRISTWFRYAVVGLSLLFVANGLLIWAEQFMESGTAAIFIVTVALWMALFDAVIPGSPERVTWRQLLGLSVAFLGTALLVGDDLNRLEWTNWRGPLALTASPIAWALGSVYAQRRPGLGDVYLDPALQMLIAGAAFAVAGLLGGEVLAEPVGPRGWLAVAYLIVFGSLVSYSAYIYLLRHASPTLAGTAAYLNTMVAVLLGWLILDEALTVRKVTAMVIVLSAVGWIQRTGRGVTKSTS